ncbi:MAG: restriction endonuclease subunit S, partial [Bacteroidales bacterium]|nr:restriction endonuclease subunit S [Bacteroidales bacterium]
PNDEPASELLKRIQAEKAKSAKGKKSAISSVDLDEVPFEVPSSWCWTTIGEITPSLQYGTSEKSSKVGKVAVLRMGNITRNGTLDYSDLVYTSNEKDIETLMLKKGDVLFNRTNSSEWVGKVAVYEGEIPAIYAGYIIKMTPFIVNSNYLTYVMISKYERDWCNLVKTDGINQSNINSQKLASFPIPLPPLAEQHRIVAAIEKWFAVIDQLEKNEADLKKSIEQTKKKVLDLAIRGKLVAQNPEDEPAGELLARIRADVETHGRASKSKKSSIPSVDLDEVPFEVPSSWCWTTIGELLTNRDSERKPVSSTERKKQSERIYDYYGATGVVDKVASYLFDERLLLIGEDGANLLSRAKDNAFFAEGKYWVNNHAHILDCKEKSILDYVAVVVNSMSLDDYITGSAQPKLSQDNLNKILIPLPPLAEQKRIVEKIEEVFGVLERIEGMMG